MANSMADEMLKLSGSLKNQELRKLKTYSPAMHGMVKARMQARREVMVQPAQQH